MIDGDRWINERLGFLRELLETDLSEKQRAAVAAEIASLATERGIHYGGPRRVSILRRWLRRYQALPPPDKD